MLFQEGHVGDLLENGHDAVADPVDAQGGGQGEADPQGEQGHDDHGGPLALVHHLLGPQDLGVDLVGDDHGHHAEDGGDHGDQPQPEGIKDVLLVPEHEVRDLRQVQPQEGEVDLRHVGQVGDGGDDLVVVVEHVLGHGQLRVGASAAEGLIVQQIVHGLDVVRGHVHEVGQGPADDAVDGHQEGQGQEGPQTAAGGLHALLVIELLELLRVFLPVPGVLLLQDFLFLRQAAHGEHAFPPLQEEGEQDDTDHQAEEQQRHAVAAGEVIEQQQQLGKGG